MPTRTGGVKSGVEGMTFLVDLHRAFPPVIRLTVSLSEYRQRHVPGLQTNVLPSTLDPAALKTLARLQRFRRHKPRAR